MLSVADEIFDKCCLEKIDGHLSYKLKNNNSKELEKERINESPAADKW